MIRPLTGLLGVLTALVPDRIVEVFERVAITNPGTNAMRPGARAAIRGEGVLVVLVSLLGGRVYAWTMYVTGAFGAFIAVFPAAYRTIAGRLLYEDPSSVEWNERFSERVRFVGVLYVLLALREAISRRTAK